MTVDDSALLHAKVYDAAKAREYYLRTRQLKGRGGATSRVTGVRSNASIPANAVKKSSRAEAQARLASLQGRLDRLKDLLTSRVNQAKERSGVKVAEKNDTTTSPADKQKEAKGKSPSSAKEKKTQQRGLKKVMRKIKISPRRKQIQTCKMKSKRFKNKSNKFSNNLRTPLPELERLHPTSPSQRRHGKAVRHYQKGDSHNGSS